MNVLVDTCVWSLAFRRRPETSSPVVDELAELIREFRAKIIGPIRQELLSGIRKPADFQKLRRRLRGFPDVELRTEDYERAAAFFTLCRKQGIQGSNTDFLICAVSSRLDMAILTIDADFQRYARRLPIRLHTPGKDRAERASDGERVDGG